jgi:flagellar M-ring protein FliF
MKDQIVGALQRFWRGFLSFTPGQKVVTVAAIIALSIGGYAFSTWAAKPTYAPLFTNLSPTDASAMIDKLNTSKIPYQLGANGTEILVPQQSVYSTRLTMSSAGLPTAGTSGYSLLDKEGITTSEFKQRVDYQRALEGELAKTIKSINGVTDAQVHLAIPQQTVFNDGTQKPTGSVLITTAPGTTLASGQVQSIVNLVSSSVTGLTPDQVSVSDASGRVLSSAGGMNDLSVADTRAAATQQLESRLSGPAQTMLDNLVGTGHSTVTVTADLNFDKTNTVSSNYVYNSSIPPLAEASTAETYAGSSASTGGVLGAASPSPTAGAAGTGANGYVKNTMTRNNAVGQVTESSANAPGNIRTLSVAVLLDKNAGPVNAAQVQQLVSSAVGLNAKRGDTIAVSVAPFNTAAASAATKAAAQAAAQAKAAASKAALMSMIKTGGTVLLVIFVLLATFIANKRRKKAEPDRDDLDDFLSTLSENPGLLPPAPQDIVPPPTRDAQAEARQRQLAEMAENDPQEVARLLRNWLNAKEG